MTSLRVSLALQGHSLYARDTTASQEGSFAPSSSRLDSRASLIGRLGSALQSLTGRVVDNPEGIGDGPRREGRLGPRGTKYTQRAAGYSPFERPANQQLRKRLPTDPAFTAAAVVGASQDTAALGGSRESTPPTAPYENGGNVDGHSMAESAVRDAGEVYQDARDVPPVERVPDDVCAYEQHAGGGERTKIEESRGKDSDELEEAVFVESMACKAIDGLTGGVGAEGPGNGAALASSNGTSPIDNDGDHSENGRDTDVSLGRKSLYSSMPEDSVGVAGTGIQKLSKNQAGLWELKAERSRLEQAITEAEIDRQCERVRAEEAEARLKQAVARLQHARLEGCVGV